MLCSVIMNPKYVLKPLEGSTLLTHPCNAATWSKVGKCNDQCHMYKEVFGLSEDHAFVIVR